MERQLVHLDRSETDRLITIKNDGCVIADTGMLAAAVARSLGVLGVRAAVSSLDHLQSEDGALERDTRTVAGIWWHSHGDDTALIGGFVVEGHDMTITTEGEGESPLAEDVEIIDRATRAIASQYEGAEIVKAGLMKVPGPSGVKAARVVVTRDHRIRRPEDILGAHEHMQFRVNTFGLAIVQLVGGNKALVIKHGL